jgi:hypothetical protein
MGAMQRWLGEGAAWDSDEGTMKLSGRRQGCMARWQWRPREWCDTPVVTALMVGVDYRFGSYKMTLSTHV